jgi:1-acyl-sn-glycerol-3-phosphate acyltransferase
VTPTLRPSATLRSRRAVRRDATLGTARGERGSRDPRAALAGLAPAALAGRIGRSGFPFTAPSWPGSVPRPTPAPEIGLRYDSDWSRRYPARLVRAMVLDNVTRPVARVLADPLVRGTEELRALGAPVIFAANHASHADAPLLLTCLPLRFRHRTAVAAAADYFFDRRWKAHAWSLLLATFPIERAKVNRRSAELATELLADDWNLVIFPEGGRSPDGWAQTFRGGAAYLAVRTGRPIVPVHLDGTRHILPKGRTSLRRTKTTVTFGAPLWPEEGEDARRLGARFESALAVLAAEIESDWWTARRQAAEGRTPRLQGPEASSWRRSWLLPADPRRAEAAEPPAWPRRRG